MTQLHPDDLLFFTEVTSVMRKVAAHYNLPLAEIVPHSMPTRGMADALGTCSTGGRITLVMRATVDGQFVDAPRSPEDVWRTAAHELAHLKHMNHGAAFQTFELEMQTAVKNFRVDHKQKVIDRLLKMQAARDGEAKLGHIEAAESFAAAINRMLLEHELTPNDLDYARATDDDPIVKITVDLERYRIPQKRVRIAWQEQLAQVVAKAHLCKILVRPGSNYISFVGTKSHAMVAEYTYGVLVPAAQKMCAHAYHVYGLEGSTDGKWRAPERGFNESWMAAFIERISERFDEARRTAIEEFSGEKSTALIRLDGALVKAQRYIDDKFTGKAAPVRRVDGNHQEGRSRGRAAADAMPIGRRAVTGSTQKLIGGN